MNVNMPMLTRSIERRRRSLAVQEPRGFTLVEIMMAIVVTGIIVGAGFGVLIASEKATRTSGQVVDAQQSVRLAMELLSRDVKLAGYGWQVGTQVGNCVTPTGTPVPIVPLDQTPAGPDTGPDQVRMVVPMTNTQVAGGAAPWTLSATTLPAFNTLQLQPGAVAAMQQAGLLTTSNTISINGGYTAQVTGLSGANGLMLATAAPIHITFPANAQVYLLQCIQYSVSANPVQCGSVGLPCLMRGPVGPGGLVNNQVAIADGIEDLQLAYACDQCTAGDPQVRVMDNLDGVPGFTPGDFMTNNQWTVPPMTPERIRLVQVNLVARQTARAADQGLGEGTAVANLTPNALQVSDHNHVDGVFVAGDFAVQNPPYTSLRRRVLTKTIDARNLAMCDAC